MGLHRRETYERAVADAAGLAGRPAELAALADWAAARVCRADLGEPGFALLDLGAGLDGRTFRALLIDLAEALGEAYRRRQGRPLRLLSLDGFDQQRTTEPHLDGGPEESLLLLGYEPTAVVSRVFLLDYARCACEKGESPEAFLQEFNPMAGRQRPELADYTTEVEGFDPARYQVLLVNNSLRPCEERGGMLGVLHRAVIVSPRPGAVRQVNSLMLTPGPPDAPALLGRAEIRAYVEQAQPAVGG